MSWAGAGAARGRPAPAAAGPSQGCSRALCAGSRSWSGGRHRAAAAARAAASPAHDSGCASWNQIT